MSPNMADTNSEYLIYYRRGNRDHFMKGGDTLCSHNVRTPDSPDSDDLKLLTEVTEREWQLITGGRPGPSNLCTQCRSIASRKDLILEDIPDGIPSFPCPECGKDAERIMSMMGMGYIEHEDGERHRLGMEVYESWRRGENPEEIEN